MKHAKIIKVLSVLALIVGILGLIGGVVLLAGGGMVASVTGNEELISQFNNDPTLTSALDEMNQIAGTNVTPGTVPAAVGGLMIGAAVMVVVSSIFAILEGVFGFRAARGKGATAALIIGIISLATAVVHLITSALSGQGGGAIIGAIPAIIIAGIYVYCAKALRDNKEQVV